MNDVNPAILETMSNPIRMRILGVLRINGDKTVGDISALIHQAPGVVSYHLRQLASVGLVEKVDSPDGDKRKSWWRACSHETVIAPGRFSYRENSSDSSMSAKELTEFRRSTAISYEMAFERFLDQTMTIDPAWIEASTSEDHVVNLTPEQTKAMLHDFQEVIKRWVSISQSNDQRLDGDAGRGSGAANSESDNLNNSDNDSGSRSDEQYKNADNTKLVAVVLQIFRWIP